MTIYKCPICHKPVRWTNSPIDPFCSKRCKIKDLATWGSSAYVITTNYDLALSDSIEDSYDRSLYET